MWWHFLGFVYFLFDVFHVHLVCVSDGIVVGVSGLFLWVADGFLCRVLCISVLSLSRLCMISLAWFGLLQVRYKGQSHIEDLLFSCCEYFVAQVDYCVRGVRLVSSLVSGFSWAF